MDRRAAADFEQMDRPTASRPLIEHILAVTADGSPERAAAMNMWRLRLSSVPERRSRRSRRSTDVLLNTKESK
jgi:hypothetical protein